MKGKGWKLARDAVSAPSPTQLAEAPADANVGLHSMGQIIFKSDARRAKDSSKFAVVGDGMQAEHVCDLLEQDWNLKRPSVLLSVTGSASHLELEPRLQKDFIEVCGRP